MAAQLTGIIANYSLTLHFLTLQADYFCCNVVRSHKHISGKPLMATYT